jgi:NifU-like protein involved in Fe-S cluster formation
MLKLSEEEILEILSNPPFKEPLDTPASNDNSKIFQFSGHNQSCGDRVEGKLQILDGRVSKIFLKNTGCTLSKISSILWLQYIESKNIKDIKLLSDDFIFTLVGNVIPLRNNCALLTPHAVKELFIKENL